MSTGGGEILLAFLAGAGLGAVYVLALWGAVSDLVRARRPALWLVGGALLRLGVVLGAFYLVMDGSWQRLVACLAGFLVVRVAATRWAGAGRTSGG